MRIPRTFLAAALAFAAVAHAALPGEPDPTFNGGLPLLLNPALTVPRLTFLNSATLDDAGRLIVTGGTTDAVGHTALLLTRLLPGGEVDGSFGTEGFTIVQLGLGTTGNAPFSSGFDIGARPSGLGWLAIGSASVENGAAGPVKGLVAAFDANGMLDTGYGTGGAARPLNTVAGWTTSPGGGAVAADGTVYLTGQIKGPDPLIRVYLTYAEVQPSGALGFYDESLFDPFVDPADYSSGARPLVTPDGVLIAGTSLDSTGFILLVARGDTNGNVAGVFVDDVSDPVAAPTGSSGAAIAVDPSGNIYAAGAANDADGKTAMSVTRILPNGMADSSFGEAGTRRVQAGLGTGGSSSAVDVLLQADGSVVLIGIATDASFTERQGVVARLDTTGGPDPTFGNGGVAYVDLDTPVSIARGRSTPDGQSVILTGSTRIESITYGLATSVRLTALSTTTTSTTVPPPACAVAPSVDGARCRLAALAGALDAALGAGKLEKKLLAAASGAETQLAAAATATGKVQRKRLRKAGARMRRIGKLLASKKAEREIPAEARAASIAEAAALADELQALAAAGT